jgi:hypothetical protein
MPQATPMTHQVPNHAPKPPRKNPFRDGYSSCAQKYDVYEMIRHPHAHKNNRPPIANLNSDKRPSKQKKIEKEVQAKFEQDLPGLPWNRFKILGKISKMLFLAIALPFYLLLYGFPKIIFCQWIPFLVKQMQSRLIVFVNRIRTQIKNLFNKLLNPFRLLWKLLKPSSKNNTEEMKLAFDEQGMGFFAFIAMSLWYSLRPIVKGCYGAYILSKKSVRYIRELPGRCHRCIQNFLSKIMAFPKVIRKKIKETVAYYIHQAKQKIQMLVFFPVKNRIQNLKLRIYAAFRRSLDLVKNKIVFFKKATASFFSFYSKILSFLKQIHSIFSNGFNKIKKKMKSLGMWMRNRKNFSLRHLQSNLKPAFNYTISTPFTYVKQVQRQIGFLLKKSYADVQATSQKFAAFYLDKTKGISLPRQFLSNRLNPVRIQLDNIKKRVAKIYTQIVNLKKVAMDYILSCLKLIIANLLIIFKPAKRVNSFILFHMASYKSKIASFIKPFSQYMKNRKDHFILHVRITIAWAKVLVIYGMYQVSIVTREMGLGL